MKNCKICETREQLEREGETHQSVIEGCRHDGTARFLWYGQVPKNERDAERLIKAFLEAFKITKPHRAGNGAHLSALPSISSDRGAVKGITPHGITGAL